MQFENQCHSAPNVFLGVFSIVALFIYNVLLSVLLLLTPRRYRRKKDITGQKVLITGAGNGLGRQLAIQFSKKSTCLLLLDIDKPALLETSSLLHGSCRAFVYQCDITRRERVYAVAEQIKNDVGDVDILVNNAGVVVGKSFIDLEDDGIRKTLEVNTLSHFWMCKAFLPSMMARNSGHIVTIASVLGRVPLAKLVDYCASKYAAVGFSESLELELRAKNLDGIKVTIVCPFHINTRLFHGVRFNVIKTEEADHVAAEILDGIRMEEETVYAPRYLKYMLMMKSIVPRWLYYIFLEKTGNVHAMDSFKRTSDNHDG